MSSEKKVTRFTDREAVDGKIEWEGGIFEALDYGIEAEEMPDPELEAAWAALVGAYKVAKRCAAEVEKLLEEPDPGEEVPKDSPTDNI